MISRRGTLLGISAAVYQIGCAEAVSPTVFANKMWHRPNTKLFGDYLRSVVCSELGPVGGYGAMGSHRTSTTQYIDLFQYTRAFSYYHVPSVVIDPPCPYDVKPPVGFEDTRYVAWVMAAEIMRAMYCHGSLIKLVTLDGRLSIDTTTFQPVIQFYIERNV